MFFFREGGEVARRIFEWREGREVREDERNRWNGNRGACDVGIT